MKTFKRKRGQPRKKREALRFALNEHLNDIRMMEEIDARNKDSDEESADSCSADQLMDQIRKSYAGRFRTKRLRKKHAELMQSKKEGVFRP